MIVGYTHNPTLDMGHVMKIRIFGGLVRDGWTCRV